MALSYKDTPLLENIEVTKAIKNLSTGKWDCPVKYNGTSLTFSSPRIKFIDGILTFKIHSKKRFIEFLEQLDSVVIDYLHANSQNIFKGKTFTQERLKNSLQPQLDIDEDGTVCINAYLDENAKCFDIYGDQIPLYDIGTDVTATLKVDKIVFSKDLYRIKYSIVRLKMSKPEKSSATFEETHVEKKVQKAVSNDDDPFLSD
jgi:hypothetical protein